MARPKANRNFVTATVRTYKDQEVQHASLGIPGQKMFWSFFVLPEMVESLSNHVKERLKLSSLALANYSSKEFGAPVEALQHLREACSLLEGLERDYTVRVLMSHLSVPRSLRKIGDLVAEQFAKTPRYENTPSQVGHSLWDTFELIASFSRQVRRSAESEQREEAMIAILNRLLPLMDAAWLFLEDASEVCRSSNSRSLKTRNLEDCEPASRLYRNKFCQINFFQLKC